MAKLIVEKKNEYFNVNGGVQAKQVWTVRDPHNGSLLFVFRQRAGQWQATEHAPLPWCQGVQEAPESAEFFRDMVRPHEGGHSACITRQIGVTERAFNRSVECFGVMVNDAVIDSLRQLWKWHLKWQAEQAREDAELKKLRDEFDSAPKKDRADLSVLQGHLRDLSLEYPLFNGELDQSCLVLRQAGEIRAHFWVSKERRRAEFNVSGSWTPAAFSAEEIPQRGLRIPVIRALKFLEERISQILPAPRLPKEIAGRSFTGKGFELWLARMSQGPFGLDDACMASYGAKSLDLNIPDKEYRAVWVVSDALEDARRVFRARHRTRDGGFYVWRISKEALAQARRDGKSTIGYFSE